MTKAISSKKQLFGKLRIKDGQRVCRVERCAEGERFLVDVEIAAVVGDAGVRLLGFAVPR